MEGKQRKEYIKGSKKIRITEEEGHVKIECFIFSQKIETLYRPFNNYKPLVSDLKIHWMGV